MIIIETSKGPKFVNKDAIERLEYNSKKGIVLVFPRQPRAPRDIQEYKDVETVRYVNDQAIDYKWQSEVIKELKDRLNEALKFGEYHRNLTYILSVQYPDIYDELSKELKQENNKSK